MFQGVRMGRGSRYARAPSRRSTPVGRIGNPRIGARGATGLIDAESAAAQARDRLASRPFSIHSQTNSNEFRAGFSRRNPLV
jgi:hypothetical protein